MFVGVFLVFLLPCLAHTESILKTRTYSVTDSCPTIISRSSWDAISPKSSKNLTQQPAPYVVIHHSDGSACTTLNQCKNRVKGIQKYHMNDRGWQDIGYNFLIGGDGNVYEGRGFGIWGAHSPRFNSKSIGICVIGNFQDQKPPEMQLEPLRALIACAKDNNYIASDYHLIGHRQGSRTTCPGNKLFDEIKTWPNFDASVRP